MISKPLLSEKKYEKMGRKGRRPIMRKAMFFIAILNLISLIVGLPANSPAAQGLASGRLTTEQEIATEKFLSSLESALAQKFYRYPTRPIIRVAVFDFTDGAGNVVKAGRELADKITRRLLIQSQFDVVSQEKIKRYLSWNGFSAQEKLDAESLLRLQNRINTMEPGNGLHALVTGEIQKGVGRSLRVSTSLVNFQFKIGAVELEKKIIDGIALSTDIPLPTEQAVQEATEIVLRKESRPMEEGRLLILANTRGNALLEAGYAKLINKDQPFPWERLPYILVIGKEEASMPEQIKVGLGQLLLAPVSTQRNSSKRLEYSFLHGKLATNEVYFDERIPAQGYQLITSFLDLKTNGTYSESAEVQVYSGATNIAVLSIFVPSEKERIRNRQTPRIRIFQLSGKGMEILPSW